MIESCQITTLVRIPQNSLSFFLIEKNTLWKDSVKISFKLNEEINFLNLFFIITSYFNTNFAHCTNLCTVFKDKHSDLIVSQNENVLKFKNMNFMDFKEGISYRIENDGKYNNDEIFYCVFLIFEKKMIELMSKKLNIDVLNDLKPIYPGSINLLKKYENDFEKEIILKEKIKSLENELKLIKNKKV